MYQFLNVKCKNLEAINVDSIQLFLILVQGYNIISN